MNIATAVAWMDILPSFAQVPYTFERSFEKNEIRQWFIVNWTSSFYYIAAYLLVLGGISKWMERRSNSSGAKLELRRPLLIWNLGLALFSLVGTIRLLPELLHILGGENGYHNSVCDKK